MPHMAPPTLTLPWTTRTLGSCRCTGGISLPRLEAVAGAAHCTDRVRTPSAHQRLAQSADVHVNGALVNVDLIAPHAVEQLAAREHPPGRLHEELEQPVVGGAQMDHLSPPQHRH